MLRNKKFKIPKKATIEGYNLSNIRMLLIGPPKIGKSTFASEFNKSLFLDAEKGTRRVKARRWKPKTWEAFCAMVDQIVDEPGIIQTVIPDTISTLYKFCLIYCSKEHKMKHPSDFKWGKGWSLLRMEFEKPILKLISSDLGVIFISHEKDVEITMRGGIKKTKTISDLPESARSVIMPLVDIIGQCYMQEKGKKERRYITFAKSSENDAGDRTGLLPNRMPLRYSKFKSYFDEEGEE